jgi:hypothetical protein
MTHTQPRSLVGLTDLALHPADVIGVRLDDRTFA